MMNGRASASFWQLFATLTVGFPAVSVAVLGLALCWPAKALAAFPDGLLDQARTRRLAEQREWQILLHYKPARFAGVTSLIDDPDFFLAPTGKTDPQAELEANLAALFLPADPEQPQAHLRCRFPARSRWLNDALAIDPALLPAVECRELEQAMAQVAPQRAVLIFPGNHNNSPASMFGHTLISVEGEHQSRLLSYAVNYAAHTDETNGFAYAVKGVFGLYPGYYSFLPYYVKVREYSDLERRDVWEYQLDLTPAEVEKMTLHIWELRDIASKYYFFDENCSYNLLFLVEAARPTLNLTDQNRPWVIPIDTVRIVTDANLVKEVRYRPSKATRIATLAKKMDANQTDLALELLADRLPVADLARQGLDAQAQMRILDVAIETTEFRYYRQELDREAYRQRSLELLKARSLLGRADDDYLPLPDPGRPDHGHGSNRLALGVGVHDDDWYQELRLRPAYHNLIDHDAGYLPGSQIDFANLVLRYTPERNQFELQALDLINIVSLSPRHAFFQPVSWKVNTGFHQRTFKDDDQHLVYRLNPGGGFTWGGDQAMAYVMMETDALLSGRFRDSFALGVGGSAGLLVTPLPDWKLQLNARQLWYDLGEPHRALEVTLQQNWRLGENLSLGLELGRERIFGHYATDSALLVNYYW
jgi:hypothetical protein